MEQVIIREMISTDLNAVTRIYEEVFNPTYISFSELAEGKAVGLLYHPLKLELFLENNSSVAFTSLHLVCLLPVLRIILLALPWHHSTLLKQVILNAG